MHELSIVRKIVDAANKAHEFHDGRFDDHDFAHDLAHAPLTYLPAPCPKCQSTDSDIIKGRELELIGLEGS